MCATGAPLAPIARQFGLTDDALGRHFKRHVTDEFKRSVVLGPFRDEAHLRKLCAESGTSVLDNLRTIYSGVASRWLIAYEAGADDKLALLTIRLHSNLELQGKLTRELMPPPSQVTNNFFSLPIFGSLQSRLLATLRDFPEARAAVLRAFKELADEPQPGLIEVTPSAA